MTPRPNAGLRWALVALVTIACSGDDSGTDPEPDPPGPVEVTSQTHAWSERDPWPMRPETYRVGGRFTVSVAQENGRASFRVDSVVVRLNGGRHSRIAAGLVRSSFDWQVEHPVRSEATDVWAATLFGEVTGEGGQTMAVELAAAPLTVELPEYVEYVFRINQYDPHTDGRVAEPDTAEVMVRHVQTGGDFTAAGRGEIRFTVRASRLEITPTAVDNQLRWSLWVDAEGFCQATDWINDTPVVVEADRGDLRLFTFRQKYLRDGPPMDGGDGELAGSVVGTTKGYVPFDVILVTRGSSQFGITRGRVGLIPAGGRDMRFVTLLGTYTTPIVTLSQPFSAEMLGFRDMMLDAHEKLQEQALCANDWGVNRLDVQPGGDPRPYFDPATLTNTVPIGVGNNIVAYRAMNSNNPQRLLETQQGQWIIDGGTLALAGGSFGNWSSESILGGMSSAQLNGNAHEGCSVSWSFLGVNDYCNPGSGQPNQLDGIFTDGNMHFDDEAATIIYYDLVGTFNKAHPDKNFSYWDGDAESYPRILPVGGR